MSDALDDIRRALADRYDVVREVGRGGMAVVYLARTRADGHDVAVKVLNPDLAGSVGVERFLREIKIASDLQHPGILPLLDSGTAEGNTYYIMPFVDGETLRDRLRRERPLGIHEAVQLAIDVADALEYAHARGFVHRDIKPENLLLADGRVLVSDFGIARAVDQAGSEKLTESGLAVGTPTYMSPEQWMGERLDGRSDLYALGCVLFEMLIGEPPFSGPSPQVVMARHSMEPLPSMRVARATISPELEDVVRRALSKIPADRFASVGEFGEMLRSVRREATREEMIVPPGSVPRIPPGGAATQHTSGAQATTVPSTSPPWRRLLPWAAALLVAAGALGAAWWRAGAGAGGDDRTRVVVLPFRNVGAAEDAYFVDGITEEITSRLSSVHALGVIARTSANQYRNSDKDVKQIGEELDVRYVLEGSVRWNRRAASGPGVRISIRLINVADGTPLWS
ncbi:MAG TPA: serine/threonine-protein kinase, partial [Gemmatimonadaceae bacterium]|nr:serine/threonine-protein kinase [Gemmatimonadaceae bacterium]